MCTEMIDITSKHNGCDELGRGHPGRYGTRPDLLLRRPTLEGDKCGSSKINSKAIGLVQVQDAGILKEHQW